jgi:DNA-binding transcriptional ArsR family regulator
MSSDEPGPGPQPGDENPRFPGVRQLTDARTMRALAHPVRIALLEALVIGGAMTATEVGERIGESPTTCSFHLRQLAKYGFVEEAGGGVGRARPWKMTSIGMSFAPGGDPEAKVAAEATLRLFRERQFARYQTWRATSASYPQEWRDASDDSAYVFYLTADELEQMSREVSEVLMRWFRLEGRMEDPSRRPPDALPVETLLVSYPTAVPKLEEKPEKEQ